MILWYIIGFVLLLIASCEYYAFKTGVPTVTSFPSARKKMIALLVAEAVQHKGDAPFTILDLGSGTGKLTLEIGRALPEAMVIGLEISLVPFLLSRLRKFVWRVKNVTYKRADFWTYDLSGTDAVTLYINGTIRERMGAKLKEGLPSGAFIVSNETHLPDWTPVEIHETGLLKLKLVVYRQA